VDLLDAWRRLALSFLETQYAVMAGIGPEWSRRKIDYLAGSIGDPFSLTSFFHGNLAFVRLITTALMGDAVGGDPLHHGFARMPLKPDGWRND
jgi:hypothetical protein